MAVGSGCAHRLPAGTGSKRDHVCLLIFPQPASYTGQGKAYEGRGISHDVPVDWSPDAAREGKDNQPEKAGDAAKSL